MKKYIILLLLLCFCYTSNLMAQKKIKSDKVTISLSEKVIFIKSKEPVTGRVITKYDNSKQVKSIIDYKNGKKDGLSKEWFSDGKLESESNYKNGKKDGLFKEWYTDGKIKIEANYLDGKKDGLRKEWYSNGNQKFEGTYAVGLLQGNCKQWYTDGKLESEVSYKNGKKDGLSKEWFSDGNQKFEGTFAVGLLQGNCKQWYTDGKLETEVSYKNGKKDGLSKEWYSNGNQKFEGTYAVGLLQGNCKQWYTDGKLETEVSYKNGKKDGLIKKWYSNGNQKFEGTYAVGLLQGNCKQWYTDGKLESEVSYKNGKKDGLIKEWYTDGKIKTEANYLDGKLHGVCKRVSNVGQVIEEREYLNGFPIEVDISEIEISSGRYYHVGTAELFSGFVKDITGKVGQVVEDREYLNGFPVEVDISEIEIKNGKYYHVGTAVPFSGFVKDITGKIKCRNGLMSVDLTNYLYAIKKYREGKVAFSETSYQGSLKIITYKNEDVKVIGVDSYIGNELVSSYNYNPNTGFLNGPFFKFYEPAINQLLVCVFNPAEDDYMFSFMYKGEKINKKNFLQQFKCAGSFVEGILTCDNYLYNAGGNSIGTINIREGVIQGKSKTYTFIQKQTLVDDWETSRLVYSYNRTAIHFKKYANTYDLLITDGASISFDSKGQVLDGTYNMNPQEKITFRDGFWSGYERENKYGQKLDSIYIDSKIWLIDKKYKSAKHNFVRFQSDYLLDDILYQKLQDIPNYEVFECDESLIKASVKYSPNSSFGPGFHSGRKMSRNFGLPQATPNIKIYLQIGSKYYKKTDIDDGYYSSDISMGWEGSDYEYSGNSSRIEQNSVHSPKARFEIFSWFVRQTLNSDEWSSSYSSWGLSCPGLGNISMGCLTKDEGKLFTTVKNEGYSCDGPSWNVYTNLNKLRSAYIRNPNITSDNGFWYKNDQGYYSIFDYRDWLKE